MRVCCSVVIKPFFSSTDHANVTLACTVQRGVGFTIGVTVSVGLDIGLEYEGIASAGLNVGASITQESSTTDGVEVQCNGPWTCGLLMIPSMLEVSGTQTSSNSGCGIDPHTDPYTVQFPRKFNNTPRTDFKPCACKNKLAWADEGAPEPCPEDC